MWRAFPEDFETEVRRVNANKGEIFLVRFRKDTEQVLQSQGKAEFLVRLVFREVDAEMSVNPRARQAPSAEGAFAGEFCRHKLFAQIQEIIRTLAGSNVMITRQLSENAHVAVLQPPIPSIGGAPNSHMGVALVVQEINEMFHQLNISSRWRVKVERLHVGFNQDPQLIGPKDCLLCTLFQAQPEA